MRNEESEIMRGGLRSILEGKKYTLIFFIHCPTIPKHEPRVAHFESKNRKVEKSKENWGITVLVFQKMRIEDHAFLQHS